MVRRQDRKADYVLLTYFLILLAFGLVMLTSASSAVGFEKFGDRFYYIKRQLLYGVLPGIILFYFFAKMNYLVWKKISLPFFIFSLLLLILVFIPGVGDDFDTGSQSWIKLWGQSFQPAEFAKLGLIVFLAWLLVDKREKLGNFKKGFLVVLGFGAVPLVLVVLQPDIGTLSILFAILFAMLFLGGAKLQHLAALAGTGIVAFALMIAVAPYRAARFATLLHPELDPQGVGYHINQAFLAIGSGGFFGRGLGHSLQKFQYLPEVHADSIYAVIAEEMGFLFAFGLVILLILIASRGLMLAKQAPDYFSRLLVGGIIIWIVTQSFLNIGAMVGVLPLTGVPLPFISHGGTALMIVMAGAGILINISKHARQT